MPVISTVRRPAARWLVVGLVVAAAGVVGRADTIVLKNGVVYRGVVDRDKPLLWVYDGLKRVVLRDSKVARIESDASLRKVAGPASMTDVVPGSSACRPASAVLAIAPVWSLVADAAPVPEKGSALAPLRNSDFSWSLTSPTKSTCGSRSRGWITSSK